MSKAHELKCNKHYFEAIERGDKNFEVRRDDRGFQKGDILVLKKFDNGRYEMDGYGISASPKQTKKCISYVMTGGQFGIEPGYVVLGLKEPSDG